MDWAYNLEIDDIHTYHVSRVQVLVHNTCLLSNSPSSRQLGKNLEEAGTSRPSDSAAHHIVAGRAKSAAQARTVLKDFGVDINDAANGVFLPRSTRVPNPTGAAVHSTLHTNQYYATVNDLLLGATSREEVLGALASIRSSLLGGGL